MIPPLLSKSELFRRAGVTPGRVISLRADPTRLRVTEAISLARAMGQHPKRLLEFVVIELEAEFGRAPRDVRGPRNE